MTLRRRLYSIITPLVALCLLAACGAPGAPQPPSLGLPKRVDDLTAIRKGDQVVLAWTPARETTDGENIRKTGTTLVCRGVNNYLMLHCDQRLATLNDAQAARWTKSETPSRYQYSDTVSQVLQQENPLGSATYAVEDLNRNGRSAGLSNQVRVPLAPTLAPPGEITPKVTPEGVQLAWNGSDVPVQAPALHYLYRVFRRNLTNPKIPELIVGEVNAGPDQHYTFMDRNTEWEQRYAYRVAPVTRVQQSGKEPIEIEGADSPITEVLAHDVFPPAVPTGLQAVYSGVGQKPFIDLTWAPNLEADLAGYNVYRHETGAPPVRINMQLVKSPAFRDSNVEAGHEYFYSASAVDQRGNESGGSEETSEKVPAQ